MTIESARHELMNSISYLVNEATMDRDTLPGWAEVCKLADALIEAAKKGDGDETD